MEYTIQFQPVFLYLATVYLKREETQAAYYCYFLSRHWNQRHRQMDQIQQVILSYLQKNSLYCRINALKALCAFGSPESLVSALLELGKGTESPLHEKVITEALLTYTGNCDDLIGRLWVRFDQFTLHIQRSILDYIRFQSGKYGPQLLQILQDPQQNKELRFAAIRYFGRYPDPGAKETLLAMIADQDPAHWEFAAISASSLAGYPGQEVVDGLLHAMSSPNWYVRYNASASLEAHGLDYEQLLAGHSGRGPVCPGDAHIPPGNQAAGENSAGRGSGRKRATRKGGCCFMRDFIQIFLLLRGVLFYPLHAGIRQLPFSVGHGRAPPTSMPLNGAIS